jgi:hypothetical protein
VGVTQCVGIKEMNQILFLQELGKFKVRSDDTWPTPDENGDYPDDNNEHPDEETIDDIGVDEDKEEADPDSDEPDDESTDLCEDEARFGGEGSGRYPAGSSGNGADGLSHAQAIANASVGTSKAVEDKLTEMHSALVGAGYQRTNGLNYQHANGNTVAVSPAPRQRSGVWEARDSNGDHQQHGYGSLSLKSHLGVA